MLIVNEETCAACGQCVIVCPREALKGWGFPKVDEEACDDCGVCVDYCPTNSLEVEK